MATQKKLGLHKLQLLEIPYLTQVGMESMRILIKASESAVLLVRKLGKGRNEAL